MADIKNVVQNIYKFNFSNCSLIDGEEILSSENGNEFVKLLTYRNFDKGIIVTPSGYERGLIYKSQNNGLIYSPAKWVPEIIDFNLNFYGLKKKKFYRVQIICKSVGDYNNFIDITDNRSLTVVLNKTDRIISEDLSGKNDFVTIDAVFRSDNTEIDLSFKIGKIVINNIILDEVELQDEIIEEVEEEIIDTELTGKLVCYGIFDPNFNKVLTSKIVEVPKTSGKGLSLYFDTSTKNYILERDNAEDILGTSFIGANYIVDFNFNKAPKASYEIIDVSNEISPETLKQGYIKFNILENGKPIQYKNENARLLFLIRKIF